MVKKLNLEEMLNLEEEKSWIDNLASLNNQEISEITTNINTKEQFDELEEQLKSERDKIRKANLEAALENEKNNENSENSESSDTENSGEEISIDEQMEIMDEILGSAYLVMGALLRCSCGTHERKLNVLKDHGVYLYDKPVIHQLDKENEKNITYFGVCNSGSKYLTTEEVILEKDIKDENGQIIDTTKVSGKRCEPYIISKWVDTKENVRIVDNGDKDPNDKLKDGNDASKGYPIVTMNSFLVCRHGGLIEPLTSGQEYDEEESQEIQNLERDKEVLAKLAGAEGLGVDLINNPEEYIKRLSLLSIKLSIASFISDEILAPQIGTSENRELLNKVMADVYRAYESEQLKNIDIDSNEFSKIVNRLVKNSGYPDETVHYFRNIMNEIGKIPDNLNDMLELVNKGEWECLPISKSVYHMHGENGEYNLKFISKDGLFEAVYNKDGELLDRDKDPINMGTYNYASPNGITGIQHIVYDVLPYEEDAAENYLDKNLAYYFDVEIDTQLGSGWGNVGENIPKPVSLDDETLELVKKYRQEIGVK